MPRSLQEILDHGDELAQRFEDYEPKGGDERPVEEYLLERAVIARSRSEHQVVEGQLPGPEYRLSRRCGGHLPAL